MAGRFSIEAIFKAKDRLSRVVGKIQSRFEKFERVATRGLRSVDRAMGRMHAGMRRAAVAAGAAFTAAGFALRSIVTSGADFEAAMSSVGAVSLQSRDQIADLEKKARELGSSTTFTATEVANAMELMGRAGFENADILAGIEGVLAAAAAEGEEIAVVADHVSNALKGMGLATTEASRVADVLALASARTNSSISSLGESLSQVAPKARQLNIPLEQVVAAVAQLQDVGLDASTAGTALKAMLSKLSKPSKLVIDDMARLGLSVQSFKDAKGTMLPLEQVLGKLMKATKKAGGNFNQSAFLARMFGLETETAAISMLKLFEEGKIQDLTKELEKAEGSAAKMAELRLHNVRGDWEKFTGAVDDVKISLFDLERGPLRTTIQAWTKWVEVNKDLIISKTGDFIASVRENLPTIVKWLTRIGTALVVFYTLAGAVKVAMGAMALFNVVAALNPFVLIAAAVVAAGVAIFVFRDEVAGFFSWLGGKAMDALTAFAEMGLGLVALFFPIDALVAAWNVAKTIFDGFMAVQSAYYAGIVAIWKPIIGFFQGVWSAVAQAFSGTLGWVFERLSEAVDAIRGLGRNTIDRATGNQGRGSDAAAPVPVPPQVVSPHERAAAEVASVLEKHSTSTEKVDVTIKDKTGRAEVKRGKRPAKGASLKLRPSGAF